MNSLKEIALKTCPSKSSSMTASNSQRESTNGASHDQEIALKTYIFIYKTCSLWHGSKEVDMVFARLKKEYEGMQGGRYSRTEAR
ncbi:hypothetical protein C1H46_040073 [Malus baccata]|uniref:Uncharacterized protein n=1 Tax=Malus baccata TaxID=106549 RepID=A0A540KJM5_MALBA|nr:hypothetical protein C1H46_040073 [Malus baccata]